MIGLVVTSTASWARQIVQKFRPLLSLKDELAAIGVTIYPLKKVRQFQTAYLRKEVGAGRAGSAAKWERFPVTTWRRLSVLNHEIYPGHNLFTTIPPDVQKTIGKVRTIPKIKVFVERFYEDPFVFIERRRKLGGLKIEVCCIGYWNAPDFQP